MQVNVAGIRRNIKNLAHNYSDPQVKVREATSNDPWGPSAAIMAEIADLTYNVVAFSEIMQMIWKRLNDHGKNWRHVYKALLLLEYLIKTGTEKVAQQCKENIYAIQTLKDFQYCEEGKDQGLHVRERAKTLVSLLKDDERLKNERTKALKAKERFAQHASGFGSDGSIDGPTQGHREWRSDGEATRSASELEYVRPQTVGEEELQLQLAMAMSREEAEQEEAKRRSDDVRLQLALSQSEQDFKKGGPLHPHSHPQPSHLVDLLGLSLGATSIASPPLNNDPWGMPLAKPSKSQVPDPWAHNNTPPSDPWQTNGAGAISKSSIPLDGWMPRTHSPSIASTSDTSNDPWLTKSNLKPDQTDPWLNKPISAASSDGAWQQTSAKPSDPWTPSANNINSLDDIQNASPNSDYDDFDVISNRAKTLNSTNNNSESNNSTLLDEMDPLRSTKPMTIMKTPQSFLGENSSLVNLDQLLKSSSTSNNGLAYNPFGDLPQPQKPNLFQQQTQPVPSINQLKSQSPFSATLGQDPWAPVNSNNSNQVNNNNATGIPNTNNINNINNNLPSAWINPEGAASNPFLS